MSKQSIQFEDVIVGKPPPLRIEYTEVPIGLLDLDTENPRLRYRSLFDTAAAMDMLLREQSTKHLKVDIKANGLLERPYVKRRGERYVVKEGNRRTTVVKDLHKDDPTDPTWQMMPVRVLPDNTTDEQMAIMLAQWHITGKLDWSAHERAGHIYMMSEVLHMPDETIKTVLHLGMPAITKAVQAYRMMMERFIVIDGGAFKDQGEGKFSFFDEFYKSKPLREWAKKDPQFESDFCRWVGEGRLPGAADVRVLGEVIGNPMAFRLFTGNTKEQALRMAKEALDESDVARKSSFFAACKAMVQAGAKANVGDFRTAATPAGREMLADARAMLETITRHADNTVATLNLRRQPAAE